MIEEWLVLQLDEVPSGLQILTLWVEDLIASCSSQGINAPTFITDHAPAHASMEEIVAEHENVRMIRLAPYSYLLNPIELVWSSYKSC